MNIKRFEVAVKYAEDAEGNGYIEGYASTWDRVPDAYGDIVKKGAFAKSLKKYEDSGRAIPLLWAHQMNDLKSYIGTASAHEDDRGLFFKAKFDDTDEAQRIRQLYKDGRLSKFSFAYDTLDSGPIELEDGTQANELRELDIFEISCVLVPANSFAEVLDVKSGKRNSKKDEQTIRDAITLLQNLLDEVVDNNDSSENDADDNAAAKDQGIVNEKADELLTFIENM
jgi:HK97 family phage prohead protease